MCNKTPLFNISSCNTNYMCICVCVCVCVCIYISNDELADISCLALSDQMKILKDQSAKTTIRAVGIEIP